MTNRFDTMAKAEARVVELEATTGKAYVAYESDYAIEPFVADKLPEVGDEVSMGFNGDSYPVGTIAKISKTYNRITTSTGHKFTRVGPTRWKQGGKNGTFTLTQGHVEKRNPHF
jgi:hypothetical protein